MLAPPVHVGADVAEDLIVLSGPGLPPVIANDAAGYRPFAPAWACSPHRPPCSSSWPAAPSWSRIAPGRPTGWPRRAIGWLSRRCVGICATSTARLRRWKRPAQNSSRRPRRCSPRFTASAPSRASGPYRLQLAGRLAGTRLVVQEPSRFPGWIGPVQPRQRHLSWSTFHPRRSPLRALRHLHGQPLGLPF